MNRIIDNGRCFIEICDKSEEKSLAGEHENKAGSCGNSRSLINHPGLSFSILTLQKIVSFVILSSAFVSVS